jgi:hypothetical protein
VDRLYYGLGHPEGRGQNARDEGVAGVGGAGGGEVAEGKANVGSCDDGSRVEPQRPLTLTRVRAVLLERCLPTTTALRTADEHLELHHCTISPASCTSTRPPCRRRRKSPSTLSPVRRPASTTRIHHTRPPTTRLLTTAPRPQEHHRRCAPQLPSLPQVQADPHADGCSASSRLQRRPHRRRPLLL